MEIIEFELPCWIVPIKPYYINELDLIIFYSKTQISEEDRIGPKNFTKIIFKNCKEPKKINDILFSIINFMSFIYTQPALLKWMLIKNLNKLELYSKKIESLEEYISKNSETPNFIGEADYNKYPILLIASKDFFINFKDLFLKYYNLDIKKSSHSQLRNLIDYSVFVFSSDILFRNIYNNTNFRLSNTFTIIEALINIEIKNQSGFRLCPNCNYKIESTKKSMNELIEIFISIQDINPEDKPFFIDILKKHYKARNKFYHNANYFDIWEKLKDYASVNSGEITLKEEIEHMHGASLGLLNVDRLIKIKLIEKLENISA